MKVTFPNGIVGETDSAAEVTWLLRLLIAAPEPTVPLYALFKVHGQNASLQRRLKIANKRLARYWARTARQRQT